MVILPRNSSNEKYYQIQRATPAFFLVFTITVSVSRRWTVGVKVLVNHTCISSHIFQLRFVFSIGLDLFFFKAQLCHIHISVSCENLDVLEVFIDIALVLSVNIIIANLKNLLSCICIENSL